MNFWQRLGNMILDAIQVVFSTAWGMFFAALTGGIPAVASVISSYTKYDESYWDDAIPVFITGAFVQIVIWLNTQKQIQRALATTPPVLSPGGSVSTGTGNGKGITE